MTFRSFISVVMLSCFFGGATYAQLKLPTFDVELKIQQNLTPGDGQNDGDIEFVETTNFYGGAHVQINQHIALGGFYSRSFRGEGRIHYDQDNSIDKEVLQLQKGIDVRFSTSRAKKWRKYVSINYTQVEMVQVNEGYRLADKSNAVGFNLGIMCKLSNNLYLNVIELGVKLMSDYIFWFGSENNGIIDAKMGVTYNIGKRK